MKWWGGKDGRPAEPIADLPEAELGKSDTFLFVRTILHGRGSAQSNIPLGWAKA